MSPSSMARYVIDKQKKKHATQRRNTELYVGADYWTSTTLLVEKYWFPSVAHLQVCPNISSCSYLLVIAVCNALASVPILQPDFWWFFGIACFNKIYINFLFIRG